MPSRDYERTPGRLQVEYRSPTALLVAYTVNLSRGGVFIQCGDEIPPEGAVLDLDIALPDRGIISITGVVTWQRLDNDESGPRGVGVQFDTLDDQLGAIVDALVLNYSGLQVMVQCVDSGDRKALLRRLKSIVGTADIVFAEDEASALALLSPNTDLVIVDADEDEAAAKATLRRAHEEHNIPTIALAEKTALRESMALAGADEVLGNPPSGAALRKSVMHLLSSPSRVTQT